MDPRPLPRLLAAGRLIEASRDTDAEVALALGWRWQRVPGRLKLLAPPEGECFYDPDGDRLQLVPAYSSKRAPWEAYIADLREQGRVSVLITAKGAWVYVDDRSITAPTAPLALCRMVLEHEARRKVVVVVIERMEEQRIIPAQ